TRISGSRKVVTHYVTQYAADVAFSRNSKTRWTALASSCLPCCSSQGVAVAQSQEKVLDHRQASTRREARAKDVNVVVVFDGIHLVSMFGGRHNLSLACP